MVVFCVFVVCGERVRTLKKSSGGWELGEGGEKKLNDKY